MNSRQGGILKCRDDALAAVDVLLAGSEESKHAPVWMKGAGHIEEDDMEDDMILVVHRGIILVLLLPVVFHRCFVSFAEPSWRGCSCFVEHELARLFCVA